jgi:hypothetical protein
VTKDRSVTYNQTRVRFLKLEAELALTFAEMALTRRDPTRVRTLRQQAIEGYETIVRHLPLVAPSEVEQAEFELALRKLRVLLGKLDDVR